MSLKFFWLESGIRWKVGLSIDRPRGFIVTKIKILKVVSFSGAAPWLLGPRNHYRGLDLQKGSLENPSFPHRQQSGGVMVVGLLSER